MATKSPIAALYDYLEKRGGDTDGITVNKLNDRADFYDDPLHPNWACFKIMRHQAALGSRYRKGCPMGAFVEYEQIGYFDPSTQILNTEIGKSTLVIDEFAFGFEFSVEMGFGIVEGDDGTTFLCADNSASKIQVTSKEDVENAAKLLSSSIYIGNYKGELQNYFSEAETNEKMAMIRNIIENSSVEEALRIWNMYKSKLTIKIASKDSRGKKRAIDNK